MVTWIALAAATAALAAAQPPAFSKADQLKAARELCGAAKRATALDDIGRTPEKLSGFMTADDATFYVELLSKSYEDGGVTRHAIAFGGHEMAEEGKIFTHQAAMTVVCAGMLEWRKGAWSVTARDAELIESGFNGRDPNVTLDTIGTPGHTVLRVEQSEWNAGSSLTNVTLYEPSGDGFRELVSVATEADDCGSGDPCFKWEGTLVPSAEKDELELRLKGSYRNEAGKIVKISAAPVRLGIVDGAYVPLAKTAAVQALWKALQSPW